MLLKSFWVLSESTVGIFVDEDFNQLTATMSDWGDKALDNSRESTKIVRFSTINGKIKILIENEATLNWLEKHLDGNQEFSLSQTNIHEQSTTEGYTN